MPFELSADYKDVPARIRDFKEKHPEGSLRPVDRALPLSFETIGEKVFLVYAAVAYRSADDVLPGIGCAWEPFPGTTPYTKNSELQNAELAPGDAPSSLRWRRIQGCSLSRGRAQPSS